MNNYCLPFFGAIPPLELLSFTEAERSKAEVLKISGFENSGQIALKRVLFCYLWQREKARILKILRNRIIS